MHFLSANGVLTAQCGISTTIGKSDKHQLAASIFIGVLSFADLRSMGRSTMSGRVSLFACFAVLAAQLINAENEMGWQDGILGLGDTVDWMPENNNQGPSIDVPAPKGQDGTDRVYDQNIQGPDVITSKPLYEKDGFLAGEETPVWFADFYYDTSNRAQYSYRRLNPQGTPMLKKAWDYWNSAKRGSGFPLRKIRINRGNLAATGPYRDEVLEEALKNDRINRYDSPTPFKKRSTYGNEVVYPSILLVLDYGDVYPSDKETLWTVEQLVIYALAFWGTVDSSLRNIRNPRVSLRIAGIVITTSRPASPYLSSNEGKKTLVRALSPMINYWRSVSKGNDSDFPIGSFDIVAHMTDIDPWVDKAPTYYDLVLLDHGDYAVASEGPPCKLADQIGGVIIFDDLAFNGIYRALEQMIKVLGGPSINKDQRVEWNKGLSKSVGDALKYTSCMSAPKELHRSGTPVPPILAGELLPSQKQCELANYEPDAWTCWDTSFKPGRSNCNYLKCSNQHVWGVTCSEVGPTLDGSFCNAENTKICLDGECVDKK